MCYPKPGPRCSNHARAAYVKAAVARRGVDLSKVSSDEYVRLRDEESRTEFEYYMTPQGQRYLQRKIDGGEDRNGVVALVKDRARQARQESLDLLKTKDVGDQPSHDLPSGSSLQLSTFAKEEESRFGWENHPDGPQNISDYIDRSQVWQASLTEDEQQAVHYWTSNGCKEIGEYLYTGNVEPGSKRDKDYKEQQEAQKRRIAQGIKHLDTAMAKMRSEEPVIVYRGLNAWSMPKEIEKKIYRADRSAGQDIAAHVDKTYKVGDVIEIPAYQSATADPGKAAQFGRTKVIMEIKTRRAGSTGIMSSWETAEREELLPRNMRLRVVGVQENVPYVRLASSGDPDGDHTDKMTVIQMEDMD